MSPHVFLIKEALISVPSAALRGSLIGAVPGAVGGYMSADDDDNALLRALIGAGAGAGLGAGAGGLQQLLKRDARRTAIDIMRLHREDAAIDPTIRAAREFLRTGMNLGTPPRLAK